MNALAEHDACRHAAGAIVRKACELAGLVPPLPGLGVAITEAQEQLFQAIYTGKAISAPGPWIGQAYPDHASSIIAMLAAIYDHAQEAQRRLVAEAA